jgi:cellulose synthase/poly-beta-1,6-N-acetylglucosamine synthase-like glycosyltransferase
MLTKVQAFALDTHFSVEQSGRNKLGAFINFNGTAGIWRKSCILDAGNWHDDTLTEDLDLSYRAQLKKWKFVYLEELGSPAELPSIMRAVKSQQYRWNKGGAEVARKNIRSIIKSNFPLTVKLHGILHLLNSSIFAVILIGGIVSVPAMLGIIYFSQQEFFLKYGLLLLFTTVVIFLNFLVAHRQLSGKSAWDFLVHFPVFLCLSMGMALHNGIAVFQGLSGKRTAFIRTPKAGKSSWALNTYIGTHTASVPALEWALAIYFAAGIAIGFYTEFYGLMLFHSIQSLGYFSIWYLSWYDERKIKAPATKTVINNPPPA